MRLDGGRVAILKKDAFTSLGGASIGDRLSQKFNSEGLSRPYEQDDRVFAVISLIADAFSEVELRVYESDPLRADEEEDVEVIDEGHPVSQLFARWNSVHDSSLAQTAIAQGFCLRGEIVLFLTGAGGERLTTYGEGPTSRIELPEEIWPVSGEMVQEEVDRSTGLLKNWKVRTGSGVKDYTPESVIVPRLLHPRNPYRGFGPMAAAWGASAQNYLAERYRNALLRNGGDPGGIIYVDELLDPEDRKRLRKEIAEDFDDPDAGGKTKLLEGGATFDSKAMTPKEMAFVESLAANAQRISTAFRVSKELIGEGDSNFGARLREEVEAFWRMRVIPWLRVVENSLNAHFFPRLTDRQAQNYRCRYDLSSVAALKGDRKAKAELATAFQRMGVPLNLALRLAGVEAEPIDGGDVPILLGGWRRLVDLTAEPVEPEPQDPGQDSPPEGQAGEPAEADPATSAPAGAEEAADPRKTLNGAQVASLLDIVERVLLGTLPKATAIELIVAAFPFDKRRAAEIMAEIKEGAAKPSSPPPAPAPPPGDAPPPPPPAAPPEPEKSVEERAVEILERAGVALGGSPAQAVVVRQSNDGDALARAAAADPLSDFAARRAMAKDVERRARPFERDIRAKIRRVQDRMKRAQLRAIADFAKTGFVEQKPRIEGWKDSPPVRSVTATAEAILRRLDDDAREDEAFGLDFSGPRVARFLARRGWDAAKAQAVVEGHLVSKLAFSDAEVEALVVSAEAAFAKELADFLEPLLESAWVAEMSTVAEALGMPMVSITDPAVVRLLGEKPIQVAEGVNSTIARQVRLRLLRRLQSSSNITDLQAAVLEIEGLLSQDVRHVYKHARQRALAIARTETAQAGNQARAVQTQRAFDEGRAIGKRWITGGGAPERSGGARRDNHWDLDGVVVGPNEDFDLGDERAAHPHAPGLAAKNVVNCGCSWSAVVPDAPEVSLPGDSELDPPDAVGAPPVVPPS